MHRGPLLEVCRVSLYLLRIPMLIHIRDQSMVICCVTHVKCLLTRIYRFKFELEFQCVPKTPTHVLKTQISFL